MNIRKLYKSSIIARPLFLQSLALGAIIAGCSSEPEPDDAIPKGFAAETYDEPTIFIPPGTRAQAVIKGEGEAEPTPGGEDIALPDEPPVGTGGSGGGGGGSGKAGSGGNSGDVGSGANSGEAGGFGTGGFVATGGSGGGDGGSFSSGGVGTAGAAGNSSTGGGPIGSGGIGPDPGKGGSAGAGGGSSGAQPSAFWRFDDCSIRTRTLLDSSGNGIHALRTTSTECGVGISGQGMLFDAKKDRVEALNAPQLALSNRVAVSAWVNPSDINDRHPIVLKRLQNKTAFSLAVQPDAAFQAKFVTFTVVLKNGKEITAPFELATNKWSHVAGMYDGRFVLLFVDGVEVGKVFAPGEIRDVDAPIRIGGTTQTQHFLGAIDDVWISTNEVSPDEIAAQSCMRNPATFEATPESSGPVTAGTNVNYSIAVKNNNIGACIGSDFGVFGDFIPGFQTSTAPFVQPIPSGETATFNFSVTSDESQPEGLFQIPFQIFEFSNSPLPAPPVFGSVGYEIAEPTGCHVKTPRELFVRDISVVDDPLRTAFNVPGDPRNGAWTFARLARELAPTPEDAPKLVTDMFSTWLSDQAVNSDVIPARPAMQDIVLSSWPRNADNTLNLEQAPLRLLGIVNRMDLRDLSQGKAGEGRFVFGVLGPGGQPLEFTVIMEYILPAKTEADVLEWANQWHALSQHPFPSEEYNSALQALTERFTARGAAPERPNGSALSQLRTNEIALVPLWELREFQFGADGFLHPATVKLTPTQEFNFSPTLADFINANESSIIAERHEVPETFGGQSFLAGAIFNTIDFWDAPGVTNSEARHKFSLNTCNGCHGAETQTSFLHVFPRAPGQASQLSGFMTGTTAFDPVSGQPRNMNDLGRRNADLKALVCPLETPEVRGFAARSGAAAPKTSIRLGIGRVH